MNDIMIIDLYYSRNEQAIKETDIKYGKLCFNLADNILRNHQDSEECVNDTYLGVWNTIPPTRPKNFAAFLCKIVRNLSIKRLEFNLAKKRMKNQIDAFDELHNILPDTSVIEQYEYEELGKMISVFLSEEKKNMRNVFIRRYFFMDSIHDIADKYSYSESKVKNMLYHTRKKL